MFVCFGIKLGSFKKVMGGFFGSKGQLNFDDFFSLINCVNYNNNKGASKKNLNEQALLKKAQINFIFKRTGGGNNFLELNEFFFFHSPLFLAKIVNVFFSSPYSHVLSSQKKTNEIHTKQGII